VGLALDLSGGLDHFCDWEDSLENINVNDSVSNSVAGGDFVACGMMGILGSGLRSCQWVCCTYRCGCSCCRLFLDAILV